MSRSSHGPSLLEDPPETAPPAVPRTSLPFRVVLGAIAGIALLASSRSQIRDIDLPWHLLAGEQLAAGAAASQIGQDWSFGPANEEWTSTQWLAELAFHWIHAVGGWTALAVLRVITAAIAIGVLAYTTLRHRPAALAGLPFTVAMIAIAVASQERPQQATLIGAAGLGGVLLQGLGGRLPAWYVVLPATVLWANLHGGWVLIPGILAFTALGRVIDEGLRDRVARRALALTGLTTAAGMLTPAGIGGLTAVARFREAATLIGEWQSVEPMRGLGVLTLVMLLLAAIGWARSSRVPLGELIAVLLCFAFTWSAWRNVAPGLALVAPLVAQRLVRSFPVVDRPEPRWSAPVGIGIAAILTVIAILGMLGRSHLPVSTQPIELARQIAGLPPGQRVLNSYNVAGTVLYFGGPATQVGIDGRSDRYGADYIEAYVDLEDLQGGWQQLLESLDPTAALIRDDTALSFYLAEVAGWRRVASEHDYVLLVAPGTSP